MRASFVCGIMLLLITVQLPHAASAGETKGPDAFASELLLEMHYGPGEDDGELLDMWLSHINETDPGLLAEAACYAPLTWEWPEFYAATAYAAEDEYGEWNVEVEFYGVMDTEKLVNIDGIDYPYIASLDAFYYIQWYGAEGNSFATTWGYTLLNIPPVDEPGGEYFVSGTPDGLPGDRLTYSLAVKGGKKVGKYLGGLYYYSNSADPAFPDSDYEFETEGEGARALYFDLIMYYAEDAKGYEERIKQ